MHWYKLAQVHETEDTGHQNGWTDIFGDVQRYALDAYRCQVFLTKTAHKITVSATVAHDMFGLTVFQEYWAFDLNDISTARTTFNTVKEAVRKVFDTFESSETPNVSLHTSVREAVRFLDIEHKPTTRNLSIDRARDEKGVADWRTSLYGNRYPAQNGF